MGGYLVEAEINERMLYGTLYINHEDKGSPFPLHLNDLPSLLPECLDIIFIHLIPNAAFQLQESPIVI
jgi:hypothetical protein